MPHMLFIPAHCWIASASPKPPPRFRTAPRMTASELCAAAEHLCTSQAMLHSRTHHSHVGLSHISETANMANQRTVIAFRQQQAWHRQQAGPIQINNRSVANLATRRHASRPLAHLRIDPARGPWRRATHQVSKAGRSKGWQQTQINQADLLQHSLV